ncbi:MAG: nitroreductase family protein [Lawsonella sp.]
MTQSTQTEQFLQTLKDRRSRYAINDNLPISREEVEDLVAEIVEHTPDAYNMKSARVVIVWGEKNQTLWDAIYEAFDGKVDRSKIDGFAAGDGTILYFYDESIIEGMQEQFPSYAGNFPIWSQHANGMLQSNVWSALASLKVGASLQHYNPVIDNSVRELFGLPEEWKLVAQMPVGGIVEEPAPKDAEEVRGNRLIIRD